MAHVRAAPHQHAPGALSAAALALAVAASAACAISRVRSREPARGSTRQQQTECVRPRSCMLGWQAAAARRAHSWAWRASCLGGVSVSAVDVGVPHRWLAAKLVPVASSSLVSSCHHSSLQAGRARAGAARRWALCQDQRRVLCVLWMLPWPANVCTVACCKT
jgi:hypothetical protein